MKTKDKNTLRIRIRIDKDIKEKAEELFKRLGIDMNTALNIFLCALINEQGIQFAVSLRCSASVTACLPDNIREAGSLLARYDGEKAYLEYPGGSREYAFRSRKKNTIGTNGTWNP